MNDLKLGYWRKDTIAPIALDAVDRIECLEKIIGFDCRTAMTCGCYNKIQDVGSLSN